jgi:acetyl-CoA C-acetyltransferase
MPRSPSGLQTIALAAQRVMAGELDVLVAGGLESVSLVQNEHMNTYMAEDPWLLEHKPEIFMTMLATAEVVAERYGIDRERQDAFALRSQLRTAAAQQQGRFDAEIVPISTPRRVGDTSSPENSRAQLRPTRSRVSRTLPRDEHDYGPGGTQGSRGPGARRQRLVRRHAGGDRRLRRVDRR